MEQNRRRKAMKQNHGQITSETPKATQHTKQRKTNNLARNKTLFEVNYKEPQRY